MCFYEASHVLWTRNMAEFKAKLENFAAVFKSFTDEEKNLAIETILKICGPEQLRMLSDELQSLVKRDFIKFLPTELAFNVVKFLDYHTVGLCCLVSKAWNTILSNNTEIWLRSCKRLGIVSRKLTTIDGINWKLELKQALRRVKRFRRERVSGFAKRELDAHTRRVTALCYKDGFLASGSDDRVVKLWDVASGECKYKMTCHTCSDLKFDEVQVVTASCDNTLARWEWSTGNCLMKYQGHVGAVFCVDYSTELDLVISGSSDCTVKLWQMSTGSCLATKLGHENWLISVLLPRISQEAQIKLETKNIAVSLSDDCIKVWSTCGSKDYECVASLSSEQCSVNDFFPKLLCNGREIICSSNRGVCVWSLETLQFTRLFTKHDHLLVAYGDIFSLCWKNNNLHILNNKTEECLCEMPGHWSKPRRGYRYIDCGGETAWLNDCSPELETGPVYFAKYEKQVVILQWSMDKKIFNELK